MKRVNCGGGVVYAVRDRGGGVFIVLSERKTFVDALGVTHDVQDLAWNYLSDGQEEWQWDDVLVGSSEVVSD